MVPAEQKEQEETKIACAKLAELHQSSEGDEETPTSFKRKSSDISLCTQTTEAADGASTTDADLSAEQLQKKEKNRESARKSRLKKKQKMNQLVETVQRLNGEVSNLCSLLHHRNTQIKQLQEQVRTLEAAARNKPSSLSNENDNNTSNKLNGNAKNATSTTADTNAASQMRYLSMLQQQQQQQQTPSPNPFNYNGNSFLQMYGSMQPAPQVSSPTTMQNFLPYGNPLGNLPIDGQSFDLNNMMLPNNNNNNNVNLMKLQQFLISNPSMCQ